MDNHAGIVDSCVVDDSGTVRVDWGGDSVFWLKNDGNMRVCGITCDEEFKLTTGTAQEMIDALAMYINMSRMNNATRVHRPRKKLHVKNKSGFTGVSWCKKINAYRARVMEDFNQIDVGHAKTVRDAAGLIFNYYERVHNGVIPTHLLEQYAELLKLEGGAE